MLVCLILSQRSVRIVFISFHSFFFILFCGSEFHHSAFQVTYPFFCLSYSAIDSFQRILISFIVLFIIVCLPFRSCRSLLEVSCIFSILFPRFWIIFTIIPLNSFQVDCLSPLHLVVFLGFYLFPSSGTYFYAVILSTFLCLWSPFHSLQDCSSCCFWCLPPCG